MRRLVSASVVVAIALVTGCAALAEDGWSLDAEPESAELLGGPTIPEVDDEIVGAEPEPGLSEGCVTDPIADAVVHWPGEHGDDVTAEEVSLRSLPDVDGDGREESLAVAEIHCGVTGNCPHLLYLSNDGCPRYGGGFWATWESELVLPRVRHDVHDLEVYLKAGCAGMAGTVYRLGWTGERYRVRSTIDCECPPGWSEDELAEAVDSGARDPACPG